jgi:hypothetical protein
MHTWRKPCKLQIAYSSQQISIQELLTTNNNNIECNNSSNFIELHKTILKFNKITECNSNLTVNGNDFSGFIGNNNFVKEDSFLKNYDEYLLKNETNKLRLILPHIDNKLVSQNIVTDDDYEVEKSFIFNHLIHVIIYEGRSRCRMNLSQKFI